MFDGGGFEIKGFLSVEMSLWFLPPSTGKLRVQAIRGTVLQARVQFVRGDYIFFNFKGNEKKYGSRKKSNVSLFLFI